MLSTILFWKITPDTTEDEIRQVFSQFGKVSTVFRNENEDKEEQKEEEEKVIEDVARVVRFDSKSAQKAALNQEFKFLDF